MICDHLQIVVYLDYSENLHYRLIHIRIDLKYKENSEIKLNCKKVYKFHIIGA